MLKRILLIMFVFFLLDISAQTEDSVKIYLLSPVEVVSNQTALTQTYLSTEKDHLDNLLNTNGFNIITKGTFLAQDIYGDGLKRGDIEVTVDGERYHPACPNRMDSPLSRVNPLELSGVEMVKSSAALQSGLGGKVNFVRSRLSENWKLKSSLSAFAGYTETFDGAILLEKSKQRISLRYSTGLPYHDAEDRSFTDLYSYKDNYRYHLAEGHFSGELDDIGYGAGFTYTENVSMPYLQMDERFNRAYNAHVSYMGNKLYFNYTHHIMDNALRNSMMSMVTDAKNFTLGVTGDHYDVFYRKWDADNTMSMGMMTIDNAMISDVSQFSASGSYGWNLSGVNVNAKAGLVYSVMDRDDLSLYQQLDPDAEDNSLYPLLGLSAGIRHKLTDDLTAAVIIEGSTEAPSLESQFIALQRPMNNPAWVGNTNLSTPVKAGLRTHLMYKPVFLEMYATNIWNYVELAQKTVGTTNYQTYENVDAYLLGMNLEVNYKFIDFTANYTYAENKTSDAPLAEIAPLTLKTVISLPEFYGFEIFARHTYNDAQTMIDPALGETTTPQWNRIDVGASYQLQYATLSLEVENLTNKLYYQHLSYLRNPFSSGMRVFEAGRTFRFNIMLNNVL